MTEKRLFSGVFARSTHRRTRKEGEDNGLFVCLCRHFVGDFWVRRIRVFVLSAEVQQKSRRDRTAGGVSNREWKEFQREFEGIVLFAAFKLGKSSPYTPGRPQGRGDTKDGKGCTLPFSSSPCGRGMSMLWGRSRSYSSPRRMSFTTPAAAAALNRCTTT